MIWKACMFTLWMFYNKLCLRIYITHNLSVKLITVFIIQKMLSKRIEPHICT